MRRLFIATMLCAAMLKAWQASPDKSEVDLRAAQKKETIDGDLRGAIAVYARFSKSGNRVVAAKALLRMGQCYERLGDQQSRTVYERLVREFSDQSEALAEAKLRLLNGRRQMEDNAATGALWTGDRLKTASKVSADGRYLAFIAFSSNEGLCIHDLQKGENRVVLPQHVQGLISSPVISPDGKQIAFNLTERTQAGAYGKTGLAITGSDGFGFRRIPVPEADFVPALARGLQIASNFWSFLTRNQLPRALQFSRSSWFLMDRYGNYAQHVRPRPGNPNEVSPSHLMAGSLLTVFPPISQIK